MVMPKKLTYEECRLQRLEENKQRMEALNLPILSQALRRTHSPMKKVKPRTVTKQLVVVRRSTRLANSPSPVYKEIVVDRVEIPRRVSCHKHRDMSNRVYASDEDREDAVERAEKLLLTLEGDHPHFIRSMLPSHVSGGFWLGLPSSFCRSSLPKRDEVLTLVDEEGNASPTIYLARKSGLSGGWKGFAVAHDLADGDALIFQLVYITRVGRLRRRGKKSRIWVDADGSQAFDEGPPAEPCLVFLIAVEFFGGTFVVVDFVGSFAIGFVSGCFFFIFVVLFFSRFFQSRSDLRAHLGL